MQTEAQVQQQAAEAAAEGFDAGDLEHDAHPLGEVVQDVADGETPHQGAGEIRQRLGQQPVVGHGR